MEILEKLGFYEPGIDYVWFDCESFDESQSYIDLINDLSKISKDRFLPKELIVKREGWDENKEHYSAKIEFKLDGNKFAIKVLCDEWFDFSLIANLNSILKKQGIKEQFYPVKTGDQTLIIVFGAEALKEELFHLNLLEEF